MVMMEQLVYSNSSVSFMVILDSAKAFVDVLADREVRNKPCKILISFVGSCSNSSIVNLSSRSLHPPQRYAGVPARCHLSLK